MGPSVPEGEEEEEEEEEQEEAGGGWGVMVLQYNAATSIPDYWISLTWRQEGHWVG